MDLFHMAQHTRIFVGQQNMNSLKRDLSKRVRFSTTRYLTKENKEEAAYSTDLIGINELLKKGRLPVQVDNKGFASISVNLFSFGNSEETP